MPRQLADLIAFLSSGSRPMPVPFENRRFFGQVRTTGRRRGRTGTSLRTLLVAAFRALR